MHLRHLHRAIVSVLVITLESVHGPHASAVIYLWRLRIRTVIMVAKSSIRSKFLRVVGKKAQRDRRFRRSVRLDMYLFLYNHALKFK